MLPECFSSSVFEFIPSAERQCSSNSQGQGNGDDNSCVRAPRLRPKHGPKATISTDRQSTQPPFPRENSDPFPPPTFPDPMTLSWGSNNPPNAFSTKSEPDLNSWHVQVIPKSPGTACREGRCRGKRRKLTLLRLKKYRVKPVIMLLSWLRSTKLIIFLCQAPRVAAKYNSISLNLPYGGQDLTIVGMTGVRC